ncbi:MAG: sporulation protein YunB [Clostridiales bacterium]|jgi:sporulation protein YunB|nr:sporulation protein YunB [Clostridiales bacterium]
MKYPRRQKKIKLFIFLLFTIIVAGVSVFTYVYNKYLMPSVLTIAETKATSDINRAISDSLNSIINESGVKSEDFYSVTTDETGKIQALAVNSILVNKVCSQLAEDVSASLSELSEETIEISLGIVFGNAGFSNTGPKIPAKIVVMGSAEADYDSAFIAAGINQTNFQITINVTASVKIVNPLTEKDVTIHRTALLVNTLFQGSVPSFYVN